MRLKYVDALRGFTMFLVVFWHVLALSFDCGDSLLGDIFGRFRMPIFFFISGFIGYRSLEKFDKSYFLQSLSHKAFVQLVPTLIIYSFFLLVNGTTPLVIFQEGFNGYWFTLVLFEFFLFFYLTSYILQFIRSSKLQDVVLILVIPVFWLVSMFLGYLSKSGVNMPQIFNVLCFSNFCTYLPFFCCGLLLRKYEYCLLSRITSKYALATSFAVFAISFLLKERFFTKESHLIVYHILDSLILRFSGLIFVFGVFFNSADYFNKDGWISRAMQYVGKHTLDIYLLHYFFIPDLSRYRNFFILDGEEFLVGEILIMGLGVAIPIIAICLLLSVVLRKSSVLEKYLFGVMPKSK